MFIFAIQKSLQARKHSANYVAHLYFKKLREN